MTGDLYDEPCPHCGAKAGAFCDPPDRIHADRLLAAMGPLASIAPVAVPNEGHPFFQAERPDPRRWEYQVC